MQASKEQLSSLGTIKKRSDFLKIQQKGRKWVSHGLILQAMPHEQEAGPEAIQDTKKRVGFTVSKKVDTSAVKRNRIKRRLRAVAADILPLYAVDSCDYILVGRPQTTARPYETLKNDLKWCLDKMGLAQ